VVVDLSQLPHDDANAFLSEIPKFVEARRSHHGLPDWVLLDEAHRLLEGGEPAIGPFELSRKGYCLVTYAPLARRPVVVAQIDVFILLPGGQSDTQDAFRWAARACGRPQSDLLDLLQRAGENRAVLLDAGGVPRLFTLRTRTTEHVRHVHKYARSRLPSPLRFYFRRDRDTTVGEPAGNLADFAETIGRCDPAVVRHHASRGDFSRWVDQAIADEHLAVAIRDAEALVTDGDQDVEQARGKIVAAVALRYLKAP
jgi:hypothetical protein